MGTFLRPVIGKVFIPTASFRLIGNKNAAPTCFGMSPGEELGC